MIGHRRALWNEYVSGMIDFVVIGTPSPGMFESGSRRARELEAARRQGAHDARAGKVLRRHEFTRDRVLRRSELREGR